MWDWIGTTLAAIGTAIVQAEAVKFFSRAIRRLVNKNAVIARKPQSGISAPEKPAIGPHAEPHASPAEADPANHRAEAIKDRLPDFPKEVDHEVLGDLALRVLFHLSRPVRVFTSGHVALSLQITEPKASLLMCRLIDTGLATGNKWTVDGTRCVITQAGLDELDRRGLLDGDLPVDGNP